MMARTPLFALRDVSFAYPGSEALALAGVTVDIHRGDYVALLGPNGAGKSTLLRLLAGVLLPAGGEVRLDGLPLRRFARRTLAQRIAVLPQRLQLAFDIEVEDLVALGRTPYRSRLGGLWGSGERDRTAVEAALQATDTARFRRRTVQELSGGEQQRVALALALAQEADVLLLDEPTSHLDPYQSQAVLDLVEAVRRERDLTVVAVFHDLNLSALYAEHILLIVEGGLAADGPPAAVLRADVLERAFGPCLRFVVHPQQGVPQALPAGPAKGARHGASTLPQECAP